MKPKEEKQEAKQTQETQSLFDALNKPSDKPTSSDKPTTNEPKQEQEKIKVSSKKDPEYSKIGAGSSQNIRIGDSESDLLAKMYSFMRKNQKWHDVREKEDKKYRKQLDKQKDRFLDETIEILSGKKVSTISKLARTARKSGFLKTAAKVALGVGGLLVAKDALANINWSEKFSNSFKDLIPDIPDLPNMNNKNESYATGGIGAGDWSKDIEFLNKVNKYASKKDIKASDLLGVMASESGLDPSKVAKNGATGLIQFMPDTAKGLGTSTEELAKMTISQQFDYVEKYLEKGGLKQGAKGSDIYAQVYLPSRKNRDVLAEKGEDYYESNKGLDIGNKGKITQQDLQTRVENKKKEFNIEDTPTTYSSKISKITSGFGIRLGKEHEGVDFGGKTGDAVTATGSGKIKRAGWENPNNHKQGYGQFVEIQHEDGTITRYAHLSKINVNAGDTIESGQKIGEVGSTGHSTGPHLHYEVRKNGQAIDPMKSGAFNLNPIVPDYQLSSADKSYSETQDMKKTNKTATVSILNNDTNIYNGGVTKLIQNNIPTDFDLSDAIKKQFHLLN